MKRIGIISDTHNKLPEKILELLKGCDRIIHAGDICRPDILWQLECVAPLTAVLGNNDHDDFGPSVNPQASFVEEDVRFVIVHEPRHLIGALQSFIKDGKQKVVAIHGHTHIPKLETHSNGLYDLLICPGALHRSRDPEGRKTYAIVEVEDGEVISANIYGIDD